MRVLLTGAFGYLGGRVATALSRRGATVVLSGRQPPVGAAWADPYEVRIADLVHATALERLPVGMDVVVHLASMSPRASCADPAAAFAVSALATRQLLFACRTAGVQRFLFASTASVYGPQASGQVDEMTRTCAVDAYAAAHLAGEAFCNEANRAAGRPLAVSMRLANVYGAALSTPERMAPVHNDLCRQVARGGVITLNTSGAQWRDFVWVEDLAQAIWLLATVPDDAVQEALYNVGGGLPLSVAALAERVAARASARLGCAVKIARAPGEPLPPLDYSVARLRRHGYSPSDRLDEETDRLIDAISR